LSWVAALVTTAVLQAQHRDASEAVYVAEFAAGMSCAFLKSSLAELRRHERLLSCLAAAALAMVLWRGDSSYSIVVVILLSVVFASITLGATLFGLLTTRSSRRLGDISFGVYLLQGLVLSTFFAFAPLRDWASKGPIQDWSLMTVCALLLVGVATVAHVLVERPGMLAGRWLIGLAHDKAGAGSAR
jgi:peptidoglycan/LPS O-acetylase OafA/YrhL